MNWEDVIPSEGEDTGVAHFLASYESDCATCGDLIQRGERAGYLPGDVQASCAECCGLT